MGNAGRFPIHGTKLPGTATLDGAKIGTVRKYLETVGGGLAIECVIGDKHIRVA